MDAKRRFLEKLLASGLEAGTVTTDDIVRHANAGVLASELPAPLKAKLITAALGAKGMDSKLVVDTLGTVDLAEHIPMRVLWACVADCAGRELGGESASSSAKSSSSSAKSGAGKRAQTAPVEVPKSITGPKPNAKAKGPENGDASKRGGASASSKSSAKSLSKSSGSAATGSSKSSKSRAATASRGGRPPNMPLVPRSEFEVNTDIGEDWGVDDIVEVVEEADVVADDTRLNDWRHDEETKTRDPESKPER